MFVLSDSHRGRTFVDAGEASVSCVFTLLASSDTQMRQVKQLYPSNWAGLSGPWVGTSHYSSSVYSVYRSVEVQSQLDMKEHKLEPNKRKNQIHSLSWPHNLVCSIRVPLYFNESYLQCTKPSSCFALGPSGWYSAIISPGSFFQATQMTHMSFTDIDRQLCAREKGVRLQSDLLLFHSQRNLIV